MVVVVKQLCLALALLTGLATISAQAEEQHATCKVISQPRIQSSLTRQAASSRLTKSIAYILVEFPTLRSCLRASDLPQLLAADSEIQSTFANASAEKYILKPASTKQQSVFGPYVISRKSNESCEESYQVWGERALKNAKLDGYNARRFQHTIFIFPPRQRINCTRTGIGELFGSQSWIFDGRPATIMHELGHNLGLFHSSSRISPVSLEPYGDRSSPMSYASDDLVLYNAPQLLQLGWINSSQVIEIPASSNNSLTIGALEGNSRSVARFNPANNSAPFVISFRRERFFEQPSGLERNYFSGVSIHRDFGIGQATELIATLSDASSILEMRHGLSITQISHDQENAKIISSLNNDSKSMQSLIQISGIDCVKITKCGPNFTATGCAGQLLSEQALQLVDKLIPAECQNLVTLLTSDDLDDDGIPDAHDCKPSDAKAWRSFNWLDNDIDGHPDSLTPLTEAICAGTQAQQATINSSPLDSCPDKYSPTRFDWNNNFKIDDCENIGNRQLTISTLKAQAAEINARIKRITRGRASKNKKQIITGLKYSASLISKSLKKY